MTPGFPRSQMCGKTAVEPSARIPMDDRNHRAFSPLSLPTLATTACDSFIVSLVERSFARENCGVGGGRSLSRSVGDGTKQPAARTTPRLTLISYTLPPYPTIAPLIRPVASSRTSLLV